tara:strand:+ start:493 stop:1998 length:1506 start_codon:yes stop_codon:yes gene_type:complete
MKFFEKPSVILEMANNHMGNIAHAKKIIDEFKLVTSKFEKEINFILKFQKRDNETFIHKKFVDSNDTQVQRFKDTFLSKQNWDQLINYASKIYDLACTPFDEISVDFVYKKKFKIVKIASCSANDWPLLEYLNKVNKIKKKKVLISLGGLNISTIEDIFSFFENRRIDFNFLYCVAKYPSEQSEQNLSYFSELKKRFGDKIIGFSSHENTKSILTPLVAYGAGVRVFEKHIGFPDNNIKLNQYSLPPEIFKDWLHKLCDGIKIYGKSKNRNKELKKENEQLSKFRRGVYVKKNIKKGQKINLNNIYFAFPCKTGQLSANDISKDYEIFTKKKCYKDSLLLKKEVDKKNVRNSIRNIRDKIRTLINKTNVVLPVNPRLEISHHYGLDQFYKYGLSMINIVNDKYCKKLLILLPGQTHPAQFHKLKTESFFILFGSLNLKLNKKIIKMKVGDFITIKAHETHEFQSKNGVIIEELSTSSIKSDSFYIDKKIMNNKNRKSVISL